MLAMLISKAQNDGITLGMILTTFLLMLTDSKQAAWAESRGAMMHSTTCIQLPTLFSY
jgi:hypothetical protein